MQDRGIDLEDPQLMAARSWRWLRVRILGLMSDSTSRTWRALSEGVSTVG